MSEVVVVGYARTPIGKFGGGLASLTAMQLGGHAIAGALAKSGIDAGEVDYVAMGHVLQAGQGQITARQAAVEGGIGMEVPAETINKVCLSGMTAISRARDLIRLGEARRHRRRRDGVDDQRAVRARQGPPRLPARVTARSPTC